jgi:CheY-like chemotaxis protein
LLFGDFGDGLARADRLTLFGTAVYKSDIAVGAESVNVDEATILIADDYEDNRELLRVLLTGANYNVLEARNGLDCLATVKVRRPDLIMVDLSMPGIDGWGVLGRLKADPNTASIPCVAVTAHGSDRERALELGFTEYVSKPFRTEDLLNTVRKILNASKSAAS